MLLLQDFKDTFAMNITKLAQERGEAIYATVQKKRKQSVCFEIVRLVKTEV